MYIRPNFLKFSIESVIEENRKRKHDIDFRLEESINRNLKKGPPKIITPDFGPDFGGKQNLSISVLL